MERLKRRKIVNGFNFLIVSIDGLIYSRFVCSLDYIVCIFWFNWTWLDININFVFHQNLILFIMISELNWPCRVHSHIKIIQLPIRLWVREPNQTLLSKNSSNIFFSFIKINSFFRNTTENRHQIPFWFLSPKT